MELPNTHIEIYDAVEHTRKELDEGRQRVKKMYAEVAQTLEKTAMDTVKALQEQCGKLGHRYESGTCIICKSDAHVASQKTTNANPGTIPPAPADSNDMTALEIMRRHIMKEKMDKFAGAPSLWPPQEFFDDCIRIPNKQIGKLMFEAGDPCQAISNKKP